MCLPAAALHPRIPQPLLTRMVGLLELMNTRANMDRTFAQQGGPWEFNLRDLLRWCDLAEGAVAQPPVAAFAGALDEGQALDRAVEHFALMLYAHRLRTEADRKQFAALFTEVWGRPLASVGKVPLVLSPETLVIGRAQLQRAGAGGSQGAAAVSSTGPEDDDKSEVSRV